MGVNKGLLKKWCLATAVVGMMAALLLLSERYVPTDATPAGKMRIISLAPNVTEMLFALGLGDSVVGVTEGADYPPEAAKIERVGGFASPSIERMLALSPTLVIGEEGAPSAVVTTLHKADSRSLELRIRNFGELFDAFGKIGEATGTAGRAAEVVAAMRAELAEAARLYGSVPPAARPRVFVEVWRDPITTAGGPSFIDEAIALAGGVNVAHDVKQAHPTINPEQVVEWNPDVIVLCYMTSKGGAAAEIARRIGWADIAAVKSGRVINDIDPDHLLRPGPRLIKGVRALAERLYGPRAGERPGLAEGASP